MLSGTQHHTQCNSNYVNNEDQKGLVFLKQQQ